MNTSAKGDLSVAKVTAALLFRGASISIPWGNSQRYDLILDLGGVLFTIQVKTCRYTSDGDAVEFKCHSKRRDNSSAGYQGQVDLFAAYCPGNDQVYIVPVPNCGITCILRFIRPKNNQEKLVRYANDHLLDEWLEQRAAIAERVA